jgi:hypothetical protein
MRPAWPAPRGRQTRKDEGCKRRHTDHHNRWFSPLIKIDLCLSRLQPILAIRPSAMLDALGSSGPYWLLEAVQLYKLGEEGEDFPFAILLGKSTSPSTGAMLGLEGKEELNSLDLADSIEVANSRRSEGVGRLKFDGLDGTAVLLEEGGDLVFTFECTIVP